MPPLPIDVTSPAVDVRRASWRRRAPHAGFHARRLGGLVSAAADQWSASRSGSSHPRPCGRDVGGPPRGGVYIWASCSPGAVRRSRYTTATLHHGGGCSTPPCHTGKLTSYPCSCTCHPPAFPSLFPSLHYSLHSLTHLYITLTLHSPPLSPPFPLSLPPFPQPLPFPLSFFPLPLPPAAHTLPASSLIFHSQL